MKDPGPGNDATRNISADVGTSGLYENLKVIGTVVVGTIALTYVASKYEDSLKGAYNWIMGKPKPKRNRRGRKVKTHRYPSEGPPINMKKRRDIYLNGHDDSSSPSAADESSDGNHNRRLNKRDMFYISEENTIDAESTLYQDVIAPAEDDATSITYSERKKGNFYVNSNDELVEAEAEEEAPAHWYVPTTNKEKIKQKLYKQREAEAMKFVSAIDSAVTQFKRNQIFNYQTFNKLNRAQNDDSVEPHGKLNRKLKNKLKEGDDSDQALPNSLQDKFKAELQQLSPKTRKAKLRNLEEQSVRLNDRLGEPAILRKDSDKSSTLASENVVKSKKSNKVYNPTVADLRNKNDYIFFELLSVYTENFVHGHQKKASKKH